MFAEKDSEFHRHLITKYFQSMEKKSKVLPSEY